MLRKIADFRIQKTLPISAIHFCTFPKSEALKCPITAEQETLYNKGVIQIIWGIRKREFYKKLDEIEH